MQNQIVFKAELINLGAVNRFRVTIKGLIGRNVAMKTFCAEAGIPFPPSSKQKYHTPDMFVYQYKEIDRIVATVESRLNRLKTKYELAQSNLDSKIDEFKIDVDNLERNINRAEEEKQSMRAVVDGLKNPKNANEASRKIWAENRIELLKSYLKNQRDAKKNSESNIQTLKNIKENNDVEWKHQEQHAIATVDKYIKRYVVLITKKVRRRFNDIKIAYFAVGD